MLSSSKIKKLTAVCILLMTGLYFFISNPIIHNTVLDSQPSAIERSAVFSIDIFKNDTSSEQGVRSAGDSSPLNDFHSYLYSRQYNQGNQSSAANAQTSDNHTYIEDILIAIKSTKKYHDSRLEMFLKTWIPQAPESVSLLVSVTHICVYLQ